MDDDPHVREAVAAALRAAGFEIVLVGTVDEALVRVRGGERYDAILTDVVTPGAVNALELAEQLRSRNPGIAVVVAGDASRFRHIPGVRALTKPYDVQEAVDVLNASIAAAASTA